MPQPSKATLRARRREARRLTTPDQTTLPDADLPTDGRAHSVQFEPLLTVDQAARWLGKPKATLYAWQTIVQITSRVQTEFTELVRERLRPAPDPSPIPPGAQARRLELRAAPTHRLFLRGAPLYAPSL